MQKLACIFLPIFLFCCGLFIPQQKAAITALNSKNTLQPNDKLQVNYYSSNLFDKNQNTFWTEGNKDHRGSFTVAFDKNIKIDEIVILNGGSGKFFNRNNRVKEFMISTHGNSHKTVFLKIEDSQKAVSISFQNILFGNKFTISIISVYKGSHENNTSMREITFKYKKQKIQITNEHRN